MAAITNLVIGICLMIYALVFLKNKAIEQPRMKPLGLTYKNISMIVYFGIAIDFLLIVAILVGWVPGR